MFVCRYSCVCVCALHWYYMAWVWSKISFFLFWVAPYSSLFISLLFPVVAMWCHRSYVQCSYTIQLNRNIENPVVILSYYLLIRLVNKIFSTFFSIHFSSSFVAGCCCCCCCYSYYCALWLVFQYVVHCLLQIAWYYKLTENKRCSF